MSLAVVTIIELRQAGNDTNGGGFNPSNSNFAVDRAITNADTASPVLSSASENFGSYIEDQWIFLPDVERPGWYQVASTSSNNATLKAGIGEAILYDATTKQPIGANTQ